jgi:hypothetical protein
MVVVDATFFAIEHDQSVRLGAGNGSRPDIATGKSEKARYRRRPVLRDSLIF